MIAEPRTADLAIIGAGASAAHTVLALLGRLASAVPDRPVRILVVDRDPQFFTGVAYGNRSGRASLTLSTLNDFLPDGECTRFISWVETHRDRLLSTADPAWVTRHRADVAARRWRELFVPRRWYGEYLAERVRRAMDEARSAGLADVTLLAADVTSIDRLAGRLVVTAVPCAGSGSRSAAQIEVVQIEVAATVLAIGSPSTRRLPADDDTADGLFHDVYEPGLDTTLARLRERLSHLPESGRRILVVGGNASALEFVAASLGAVCDLGARLTVLSPAGRPRNWRRRTDGEVAELPAVEALLARATAGQAITAAELYEAVVADVRAAVEAGADVAAVRELVPAVPAFLGRLDGTERAALAARYGLLITNALRQDCGDAVEVLESAVETEAVDFEAGRLLRCHAEGSSFRATVLDERGSEHLLDARFAAVVGAIGFEGVGATRAPLVRRLLEVGLVDTSSSNTGLRVDARYRAAPGVFVVGPLLAGNAHPDWLVWHAESVRRIMTIADEAATQVARAVILFDRDQFAGSARHD